MAMMQGGAGQEYPRTNHEIRQGQLPPVQILGTLLKVGAS